METEEPNFEIHRFKNAQLWGIWNDGELIAVVFYEDRRLKFFKLLGE